MALYVAICFILVPKPLPEDIYEHRKSLPLKPAANQRESYPSNIMM